ncbi:hypothetical protein ACIF6L_27020 [Kitasatospora sp. NPDC086009]|uniref:MmyB family transcriptional regulator n=1 Tax=Kitasatospora sp. NPDC086009 TaxID=3364065 RepID=UPI0037C945CC
MPAVAFRATGRPAPATWWAAHHVALRGVGTKVLHHPVVGDLTLDGDTLASTADTDRQLVVWSAEPGSPSHDALRILASWPPGPTPGLSGGVAGGRVPGASALGSGAR